MSQGMFYGHMILDDPPHSIWIKVCEGPKGAKGSRRCPGVGSKETQRWMYRVQGVQMYDRWNNRCSRWVQMVRIESSKADSSGFIYMQFRGPHFPIMRPKAVEKSVETFKRRRFKYDQFSFRPGLGQVRSRPGQVRFRSHTGSRRFQIKCDSTERCWDMEYRLLARELATERPKTWIIVFLKTSSEKKRKGFVKKYRIFSIKRPSPLKSAPIFISWKFTFQNRFGQEY